MESRHGSSKSREFQQTMTNATGISGIRFIVVPRPSWPRDPRRRRHNKEVTTSRGGIRSAVGRLAPPGTRRRSALTRLVDRREAEQAAAYSAWIAHVEQDAGAALVDAAAGPLISVIVPAFNTPDRYLKPMIHSVMRQSYPRWE